MRVELTTVAAAVCASLFLTAGPVAVLTIKSWMSIMSPAKVLSSFTSRKVSPKIHVEGHGKFITLQELRLLKNSRLHFPFASYTIHCLCQIWREALKKPSPIFLQHLREMKADLRTKRLCFVLVLSPCLNGPSVSVPTPDLISSQPLLRAPASVPARGVCLQEQPLHPRALEV